MRIRTLLKYGALALGSVLLLVVLAFFAWRETGQWLQARERRIDPADGVEVLEKVRLGGIDQWISMRGRHRDSPVLLYLHGGPGFPMMPFTSVFQTPWEEHFIVVQWDQRGTGKTYTDNDPATVLPTMHHERMLQDARELTLYLRARLHKDRIFVLGHSWGSMLGIPLVKRYPELYYAYIGTGQVINVQDNERVGYERTLAVARERHNDQAIAELQAIAPYPDPVKGTNEPRQVLRRWQREFGLGVRGKTDRQILMEMLSAGLRSPDYTMADNLTWILRRDSTYSRNALAKEIDAFDVRPLGYRFDVPVVFMLGRHDWQVPATIAAEYFGRIDAPFKQLIWFEASAHSPPSEEPEKFLRALVDVVLPLADRPAAPAGRGASP
jgi:pimeloyl-ACP methyl ester carboxylesterase